VVFGLSHTDGNQHVNFLAYPKFVEQAALGRFVDLGLGSKWMARRVELGYRRAAFAGDVLRVAVQAFRVGEAFGVVAALVEQNAPPEGAWPDFGPVRSVARMILRS
jgi:acyl-CoA thioesterase FadM